MAVGVARSPSSPRLGATQRRDAWWLAPLATAAALGAFIVYATFRAIYNADYAVDQPGSAYILSPFFSPLIVIPGLPTWLWVIGTPVEQYLGKARYLGLYFVSGLAGSAGALLQSPFTPVVGASGAIFGILGAMMILEWQVTGRLAGQAAGLIAINLVISFAIPGISWGGHVGGLIGGILVMLAYGHWGNRGRAQYGQLGLGGVLGLLVVGVGSIALAYFRVRGYA